MGYVSGQKKPVAPTSDHGYWGRFTVAASFPNVAGADLQDPSVDYGDWAWSDADGAIFVCTGPTPGAATWTELLSGGIAMSVTSKSAVPVTPGTHNLFVIAGTVRALAIWAYVSSQIGAVATNIGVGMIPTVGASGPFSSPLPITNLPAGTVFGLVPDPTGVNPPSFAAALPGVSTAGGVSIILAPGTVALSTDVGGTTGELTWYMLWEPMTDGATVTAAA
jgi:hypothetical protein